MDAFRKAIPTRQNDMDRFHNPAHVFFTIPKMYCNLRISDSVRTTIQVPDMV